ncbi:MAG: hypothetical protein ACWGPN_02450, partial [Gammaproteobacteria bacterium]
MLISCTHGSSVSLGSSASNNPLWTLGSGRSSNGTTDKLEVYVRNDNGTSDERYSDASVFD